MSATWRDILITVSAIMSTASMIMTANNGDMIAKILTELRKGKHDG